MKYWLLTESLFLAKNSAPRRSGIAAVVSDDFSYLLRIQDLRKNCNLTPWIRRRQSVPADIPLRLQKTIAQQIRTHEFSALIQAARRAVTGARAP